MKKIIIFLLLLLTGCSSKIDVENMEKVLKDSGYFKYNKVLTSEDINYLFDIYTSKMKDGFVYYHKTMESENTVIILKENDIYNKLIKELETTWLKDNYNIYEATKVRKGLKTTYNGYNIYIVTDENNYNVLSLIKQNM